MQPDNQNLYQALTTFLLNEQQKFYRLAYSYCHNPETSMDLVQSAACKALEKYTTIQNPDYMKTWFYRILINECLDICDAANGKPLRKPCQKNKATTH